MTDTATRIEVARVTADHLPALTEFYRQVWDPNATVQTVERGRDVAGAANPVEPGEPPPTWLVLQGGRAIAHVTTIPVMLWLRGEERPAYWIKGLWVLPEFQRSSAGFLVLRAAVAAVAPALALVHEPAAIRLFQALKFADLGGLPNALRIVRPRSLLGRLDIDAIGLDGMPAWQRAGARVVGAGAPVLAPIIGMANELWATVASGPLGPLSIDVSTEGDRAGIDALWTECRAELAAGPVRGGDQLLRRYVADDGYVFVHVRSGGRLVGAGIVKRARADGDPRLRGVRVATLSDLLYRPSQPRHGLAVLKGAERAARELDADALLCSASHAAVAPLTRRRGYVPLPTNLRVLARFPAAEPTPPAQIDAWWFTRGDSGGDGVF